MAKVVTMRNKKKKKVVLTESQVARREAHDLINEMTDAEIYAFISIFGNKGKEI